MNKEKENKSHFCNNSYVIFFVVFLFKRLNSSENRPLISIFKIPFLKINK